MFYIYDFWISTYRSTYFTQGLRNENYDINFDSGNFQFYTFQILKKNVQKTPEEVKELADNIKNAVDRLTNTDYIIDATKNDLAKVNRLKQDAAYAE